MAVNLVCLKLNVTVFWSAVGHSLSSDLGYLMVIEQSGLGGVKPRELGRDSKVCQTIQVDMY